MSGCGNSGVGKGGHAICDRPVALAPGMGDPVLATSFLTVIPGGLGSLGGAALAAFIAGLVEA